LRLGDTKESIIAHVKKAIDDQRITIKDISASTPPTNVADPNGKGYKLFEKAIRQAWGNDRIVAPLFVIGWRAKRAIRLLR
jgi:carboxypeptidase PM20D1